MFGLFKNRKEEKLMAIRDVVAGDTRTVMTAATIHMDSSIFDKSVAAKATFAAYALGATRYFSQLHGPLDGPSTGTAYILFLQEVFSIVEISDDDMSNLMDMYRLADSENMKTAMEMGRLEAMKYRTYNTPPTGLESLITQLEESSNDNT